MTPILDYESTYSVTRDGDVYSHRRRRILKPFINNGGYYIIRLSKLGLVKPFLIHRLVAQAYIVADKDRKYVNHKDGDKSNNSVDNLEWVTFQENIDHAVKSGRKYGRPRNP